MLADFLKELDAHAGPYGIAHLRHVVESRSGAVAAVAAPFPDPAHQTGRAVLASGFRTRVNELSPTARWCENGLSGSIRASHEDMRPDSGAARYP